MSRLVSARSEGPIFSLDHIPIFRSGRGRAAMPLEAAVADGPPAPTDRRADGEDTYAARVAKYIPGEVLAAYLTINGILATVPAAEAPIQRVVYVAVFLLCLVLTPVYLARVADRAAPKRVHLAVSTVAFVVWAYSLGGVFSAFGLYVPWLGAILLAAFTLVSGAIVPTAAPGGR